MNMTKIADFWRAMFYFTATVTMGIILYLLIVVWQPLWTGGFTDFGNISAAIGHLDETAKPAAQMAPEMLKQIIQMNQSVHDMDQNMIQMRLVMAYQMGAMNDEINQMNTRMSPLGMMPFNW
jgi:hypothetical protein